jgi:RND family efflux transporter MFP subunit
MQRTMTMAVLGLGLFAAACADPAPEVAESAPATTGVAVAVVDTVIAATTDATGMASPVESSTLSTKLMASVEQVLVIEGARVTQGQVLARLDLRDLAAKKVQAEAMLADVEAQRDLALVHATRIRALHADSAAPKAMLDAAESGLSRAEAGVRAAKAGLAELAAVTSYGEITAPFAGVIARRFVDPGAFVAPGAPLLTVDKLGALRVTATVPAAAASAVKAGDRITVMMDGLAHEARVEGTARAGAGTHTVNAILPNADGAIVGGTAATIRLPAGERSALLVPTATITRQGDLTTVMRRTAQGDLLTVVRTGAIVGEMTEVIGGVVATDSVVVPPAAGRP